MINVQNEATTQQEQLKQTALQGQVAALGKILKSILADNTDRLLPGYSDLISSVKHTTLAERDKIDREQSELLKKHNSEDRRKSFLKKDQQILDFLSAHQAEMKMIIEENLRTKMSKHLDHSLASKLTADEKVARVEASLVNPQLT